MKKIVSLVMAFAMFVGMTGCGAKETPETAVKNALDAIKAFDSEKAAKYMDYDALMKDVETGTQSENAKEDEAVKLVFKNLTYDIKSSTVDGDTATVKTEITNADMSSVITEMVTQVFALATTVTNPDELGDKGAKIFEDLLNSADVKKTTKTVDIKLTKVDGNWRIDTDEDMMNAILGGLIDAMKVFAEAGAN